MVMLDDRSGARSLMVQNTDQVKAPPRRATTTADQPRAGSPVPAPGAAEPSVKMDRPSALATSVGGEQERAKRAAGCSSPTSSTSTHNRSPAPPFASRAASGSESKTSQRAPGFSARPSACGEEGAKDIPSHPTPGAAPSGALRHALGHALGQALGAAGAQLRAGGPLRGGAGRTPAAGASPATAGGKGASPPRRSGSVAAAIAARGVGKIIHTLVGSARISGGRGRGEGCTALGGRCIAPELSQRRRAPGEDLRQVQLPQSEAGIDPEEARGSRRRCGRSLPLPAVLGARRAVPVPGAPAISRRRALR